MVALPLVGCGALIQVDELQKTSCASGECFEESDSGIHVSQTNQAAPRPTRIEDNATTAPGKPASDAGDAGDADAGDADTVADADAAPLPPVTPHEAVVACRPPVGLQPSSNCSISGDPDAGVDVGFVSRCTRETLRVFWVDYGCNEVDYGTIDPGTTWGVHTYPTHPWRIRNAETGVLVYQTTITGPGNFTVP